MKSSANFIPTVICGHRDKRCDINEKGSDLCFALAYLGVFVSLMGACCAAYCLVLRSGLAETPYSLVLLCCSLLTASACAPMIFPSRYFGRIEKYSFVWPLIVVLILLSPVLLLVLKFMLPLAGYAYHLLALVLFVIALSRLKGISKGEAVFLLLGPIIISAPFFLRSNSVINNVFMPESLMYGIGHKDAYFHSAIASIIQQYGINSTGLDGLVPGKYHFGFHMWFSQIAAICGKLPYWALLFGFQIVVIPLVCYGLVNKIVLDRVNPRSGLPAVMLLVSVLLLLYEVVGTYFHYVSESYALSLVVFLLMLPALDRTSDSVGFGAIWQVLFILLLGIGCIVMDAIKVSTGFMFSIYAGYAIFRKYRFGWQTWFMGFFVACGFLIIVQYFFSAADYGSQVLLGLWEFVFLILKTPAWYVHLLFPAVLLMLMLLHRPDLTFAEMYREIRTGKYLRLEVLAVAAMAGSLLGLVTRYKSWIYFSQLSMWIALPMLVVLVYERFSSTVRQFSSMTKSYALSFALLVLIPVIGVSMYEKFDLLTNAAFDLRSRVADNQTADLSEDWLSQQDASPREYFLGSLLREHRFWGDGFGAMQRSTTFAKMESVIRGAVDHDTLVFVPPGNDFFWRYHERAYLPPFYTPAIIGVPMLKGLPPAKLNCTYNSNGYSIYGEDSRSADLDDEVLLASAKQKGFEKVYVLNDALSPTLNRLLTSEIEKAGD